MGSCSHSIPFLMADVPREHFSDNQIQMLVRNTQNLGSGLVMLGGPNSFGAGGWTNTALEEAMPVDFQIKNAKVVPDWCFGFVDACLGNSRRQSLAKSRRPRGDQNPRQSRLLRAAATGNMTDTWLWGRPPGMMKVGENRNQMLARLDRCTPGDMPHFDPAMVMARNAFARLQDAAVKHMIIISDGDPSPPSSGVISRLKKMNVKISTVAIGAHGPAESGLLRQIANQTGGTYYAVNNPKILPRIYQKEARRVSRPLVFEHKDGFRPEVLFPHEMLHGIGNSTAADYRLRYDHASRKAPLPEVALISPLPRGTPTTTPFWQAGLMVWAKPWLLPPMPANAGPPVGPPGRTMTSSSTKCPAVDATGRRQWQIHRGHRNRGWQGETRGHGSRQGRRVSEFSAVGGTVVGPDMKPIDLDVRQTAPGRYIGEFDSKSKGNYFVLLSPGPGKRRIRLGVNVPYSEEFRDRQTNEALLKSLASLEPKGGKTGKVIEDTDPNDSPQQQLANLLATNTFRHDLPKATSDQDVWHLLVFMAAGVFFADVFVRRVAVNLDWLPPLVVRLRDRVLRRPAVLKADPVLERLRSRKAQVVDELEQRRSAPLASSPPPMLPSI